MEDLNLEFFKKKPSEELFEKAKELIGDNPKYKSILEDLEEEEDKEWN